MDWKEEYRNALLDISPNPPDLRTIIKPHIPTKLYKYGNFRSDYWKKVIYKAQIHFSPAREFNDPYDCKANFDYRRAMERGKLRESFCKVMPSSFFENFPKETVQEIIEGVRQDLCVFCFSEVWDSILMWAHYADNYNGYCIEYETDNISDYLIDDLYPVLYETEYIDITESLINMNDNSGMICCLSKAKDWSYEKEWRIIRNDGAPRYQRKAINAIYLGKNCSKDTHKEIMQWAKNNQKEVYTVQASSTQYKIEAQREL